MKSKEKTLAIKLRTQGKTYSEILKKVPVAKSTLSQWLGSIGLAAPQQQRITQKRIDAQRRGAASRRAARLFDAARLIQAGVEEVGALSARELWLIGVALYWAEGSKQREHMPSTGIQFGNSDAHMLATFLAWLKRMGVSKSAMTFELYIHETRRHDTADFRRWWATELELPVSNIDRVYYKKGNPKTNRKTTGDLYHGLLRIKVKSSTTFNRKVSGWVAGIVAAVGDGVIGNTPAFEAGESRFDP